MIFQGGGDDPLPLEGYAVEPGMTTSPVTGDDAFEEYVTMLAPELRL